LINKDPQDANRDDVLDTATNIVNSITSPTIGDSIRFTVRNVPTQDTIFQTINVTGGVGVTMVGESHIRIHETKKS